VLTVELNMGQMVTDVRAAAAGAREVAFYGTAGGIVPSPDAVADRLRELIGSARPQLSHSPAAP
jgi:2-oxoglutarate ferredoxin oxidoreductase subunit alpha